MKKIIAIGFVGGLVLWIDAQLRIRQQNPIWRSDEYSCCEDRRDALVPYGTIGGEDAVKAFSDKVFQSEDEGTYQATWAKYRSRALEIQSQLGYTVPETTDSLSLYEDDSFDGGSGEDD